MFRTHNILALIERVCTQGCLNTLRGASANPSRMHDFFPLEGFGELVRNQGVTTANEAAP